MQALDQKYGGDELLQIAGRVNHHETEIALLKKEMSSVVEYHRQVQSSFKELNDKLDTITKAVINFTQMGNNIDKHDRILEGLHRIVFGNGDGELGLVRKNDKLESEISDYKKIKKLVYIIGIFLVIVFAASGGAAKLIEIMRLL